MCNRYIYMFYGSNANISRQTIATINHQTNDKQPEI